MAKFIFSIIFAACASASICLAQVEPSLSDEAVWFGKNGKALRGVFIKEQAGEIHVFDMKTGKLYKLREETLAPKTVDWYKRMKAKRDAGGAPAPARPQVSDGPSVPLAPAGFEQLDAASLSRKVRYG